MAYQDRPDDRPTRRLDPYASPDDRYAPPPPRERRRPAPDRPEVNGGRLWAGGVATAVIAAGIGVVGLFVARGLLGIPVYLPQHDNTVLNADSVYIGISGFVAGIVATAVMHALMLAAPQPKRFFQWIVGLVTVVGVLWPFTVDMELYSQIATSVIILIMGIAIGSLLSGISSSAMRQPYGQYGGQYGGHYPPDDPYRRYR